MSNWFISRDGKEHGPFSASDLKEMAKSGGLVKSDKIRRSDMQKTIMAGAVKGLFEIKEEKITQEISPVKDSNFPQKNNNHSFSHQSAKNDNNLDTNIKKWSLKKIALLSGSGLLALIIIAAIAGNISISKIKGKIAEADTLFNKGAKKEANLIYSKLVEEEFNFIPESNKAQILANVISLALDNKDKVGAKKYIDLADLKGIQLDSSVLNDQRLTGNPTKKGKNLEDYSLTAGGTFNPNVALPTIPSAGDFNLPNSADNKTLDSATPIEVAKSKENTPNVTKPNISMKLNPENPLQYVLGIRGSLVESGQNSNGKLYKLSLKNLELDYEAVSELSKIKGVASLDISGTNFDARGLAMLLSNSPPLQELIISDFKGKKVPIIFNNDLLNVLSKSTLTLKNLNCSGLITQNEEGTKGLVQFATFCTRLDYLVIPNQPIDDQDLKNILISKKNLQTILVDGSSVTDQGINLLSNLLPNMMKTREKRLELISLIDTAVSQNAANNFEGKLFGCKVIVGSTR